jgi:integrase
MLFDWLVTGHIIENNPAHAVRGPRYTVKKGKTHVLTAEEAHALLESIPVTKKPANDEQGPGEPDLLGLRDRALIAIMVYTFARVGAVLQMKVVDYFVQGRRHWVRLHEKGGKEHDVPCHHNLDQYLHDYIEAAGIADDSNGYLFRSAPRRTGQLSTNPLYQQNAHSIIRRRAKAAGFVLRSDLKTSTRSLSSELASMKKLFLLLVATGAVISTSLPVIAAEDRADHNWNDPYWHHSKEGYWHGHRGHWEYRDHKHTFIQVGPVTIKQH